MGFGFRKYTQSGSKTLDIYVSCNGIQHDTAAAQSHGIQHDTATGTRRSPQSHYAHPKAGAHPMDGCFNMLPDVLRSPSGSGRHR